MRMIFLWITVLAFAQKQECPYGARWNNEAQACVYVSQSGTESELGPGCKGGTYWDEYWGTCECPFGSEWNDSVEMCVVEAP